MNTTCAHEACECRVDPKARFCSARCDAAAARGDEDCACAHDACRAGERSIDGNQGEGNREADRRYREKATAFAKRNEGRARR